MTYPKEKPSISKNGNRETLSHPAFGVVTVTRPSFSPGINLFGSDLTHQHAISVCIQTAKLERDLNRDWVFPTGTVLEFTMTESQWAKFVAGAGRSQATSITLNIASSGPLDKLPMIAPMDESRKDAFNSEFKGKVEGFLSDLKGLTKELEELSNSKSVSKVTLKGLVGTLKHKIANLPGDMDFAIESFKEVTESVVQEAKAEIEAHYLQTAIQYGMNALSGGSGSEVSLPLLPQTSPQPTPDPEISEGRYNKDEDGDEFWYDDNGNLTHYRDSTGYEWCKEYDANGNLTHCRDSTGFESWWEYDANGNETHYRNSDGSECWQDYDANGNETHYRDSTGYEWCKEYDANGNEIHYRDSTGFEYWREYDANGNEIK